MRDVQPILRINDAFIKFLLQSDIDDNTVLAFAGARTEV